MPMSLKDRLLAVHENARKQAASKLDGKISDNDMNSNLSGLADVFNNVTTTMAISPLESQGVGEVIVQEISLEKLAKEMQNQDKEYLVGLLASMGLLPLPEDADLKSKAFDLYVRNLQEDNPELEAQIQNWFISDSEDEVEKNLEELESQQRDIDREEDEKYMRDWQDEQNLLIALPTPATIPGGGLTMNSSVDEIKNVLRNILSHAKVANSTLDFSSYFNNEQEYIEMIIQSLANNPGATMDKYTLNHDGSIDLSFSNSGIVSCMRIMPDAAFGQMRQMGEAAMVAPTLQVYTERSGTLENNLLQNYQVRESVGGAREEVRDDNQNYSSPFNMNPFDSSCKPQ